MAKAFKTEHPNPQTTTCVRKGVGETMGTTNAMAEKLVQMILGDD